MKNLLAFLSLFYLVCTNIGLAGAETIVNIGVRAHSGIEKAIIKWQPTAEYLSNQIPGYKFKILPYIEIPELENNIRKNNLDFILTNPSSYVEMEVKFGIKRIATLKNKRGTEAYTQFGSVIITQANRNDINQLSDIKGKSFMAVAPKAFGGWRVALFEFLKHDINPYDDFTEIKYGKLQENVVNAVASGKIDAGTVRTDMLERMASAGEIDLKDIKIINPQRVDNFSFLLSTSLYPEWPFASLKTTPDDLTLKVAIALFTIKHVHPAAQAGKYEGWTVPLDYSEVHNLLKALKVSPYDQEKEISFRDIVEIYWPWILIIIAIIISVSLVSAYLAKINNQLTNTKDSLLKEIDERKFAENELLEYKSHLEDKVEERTRALKNSNRELEAYSYSIAHDLRGPLRSITSFSQILNEEIGSKLDEDEAEYLKRIIKSGKLMADLIDDILELSRVSRTDIKLTHVDLSKIAKSIIEDLQAQTENKKIDCNVEESLYATGDTKLLSLLLLNLLTNACKFSIKKERPSVEFGKTIQKNQTVFYVRDNGIGINKNYFSKIFLPFERLVKQDEFEGTGIGLATVQRIIERHNGKIWVESTVGEGTTFYFQLQH